MDYEEIYTQAFQPKLTGRYITDAHIRPLIDQLPENWERYILGTSVLGKEIFGVKMGSGPKKILAWSQMHGNESTTTKALFDMFHFLSKPSTLQREILGSCTLLVIPMLNPDGAEAYTRANAAGVDLNRDAQDLTQPESRLLRKAYEDFQPDFCFNLHDQRTIFGVGETGKPATVSFLAPAYNADREYNPVRLEAVRVINAMDRVLQKFIPGQVGRFDDGFNLNCVGDTFQSLSTPTILFEAGHFPGDYAREQTRKYVFFALLSAVTAIYENVIVDNEIGYYLNIPQNITNFFDFVYKNIKINYDSSEIITNFAAQYREELIGKTVNFNAFVVKIGDLTGFYGHQTFDGKGAAYQDSEGKIPQVDRKADFLLQDQAFENGKPVN